VAVCDSILEIKKQQKQKQKNESPSVLSPNRLDLRVTVWLNEQMFLFHLQTLVRKEEEALGCSHISDAIVLNVVDGGVYGLVRQPFLRSRF
jgi:hypothetical protein